MRKPNPLTPEEIDFIDVNWRRMTYNEMADHLNHKSVFRVSQYCKEKKYCKKQKDFDKWQSNFILKNYRVMKESELMEILGVSRFFIQRFKREKGIAKKPGNRPENKISLELQFFDVNQKEWVA